MVQFFEAHAQDSAVEGVLKQINGVILYVETFCCKGAPEKWISVLEDFKKAQKQDNQTVQGQDIFNAFLNAVVDQDTSGSQTHIKQIRDLLLTSIVPEFIRDNMATFKDMQANIQTVKRVKCSAIWLDNLAPFQ